MVTVATSTEPGAGALSERERACWVAFNRTPGIGVARVRRLLERFGTLEAAWAAPAAELPLAGLDRRSLEAVLAARKRMDPARELARVRAIGARVVTWRDPDYPALLAAIDDPPPVLYVKGALVPASADGVESSAAAGTAVAMVGTRRATVYGREVAERLARELASAGLTVVSGMAKGIDTHAHRGALTASGHTIAVLGHGLDSCYPPENRRLAAEIVEHGALVSDYAIGTGPLADNFPPRNRIISGLSAGVIVVEAGEGSGALITTRYAGEQGRDVFAVPGPITSPGSAGCHRLIQEGAKLVTGAADVLAEVNPHLAAVKQLSFDWTTATPTREPVGVAGEGGREGGGAPASAATSTEARLLQHLAEAGQAVHVDELSRAAALPIHEVTATLTLLELQGRVSHAGSMRYQLTR